MTKKRTQYFPHDYNARNDPKLQELLMECGLEAIGLYWCIVEMLYEQGGKIPLKACKGIAFTLHADIEKMMRMINEFGLFQQDEECFWSNSINVRLGKIEEITEQRRKAIQMRWGNKCNTNVSENNTNASNSGTNVIQNDTNKIKEKEIKENKVVGKEKEEEKESCDQDHSHHFLFSVIFNLFNHYFIKKASMENKADCNAINRIAVICGSEERCNILFEYLNEEKKYFKFHVGAFANMAGEKMDEALVRIAVREQEKENNQKKLAQARVQKQEEEQREVERQARFVRAIEIGEVLAKEFENYGKLSFPQRKAIQLEIAELLPTEKSEEKIIKMYYSLLNLNKAE